MLSRRRTFWQPPAIRAFARRPRGPGSGSNRMRVPRSGGSRATAQKGGGGAPPPTPLTAGRRKTSVASPPPRSRGRRRRPPARGGRSAGGRSARRSRRRRPWGPRRHRGESAQTSERDRAGAHRARLKRHIKIAADEPLRANLRRSLANDEHFSMRGRIGQLARAVSGARDQRPVANDHSADRRFAAQLGRTRLCEGKAHRIAPVAQVVRQIAPRLSPPY